MALIATPGASNANSYLEVAEADAYYATRLFATIWTSATTPTKEAALIMATRVLNAMLSPYRQYVPASGSVAAYYRTRPTWTGTVATTTQALAWPRIGMYNRNGVAILQTVIPQELKEATAELAGQLIRADRTLDNSVAVKGITGIKAGPVSLTFRNDVDLMTKVLPDAVLMLLVPSWLTEQIIDSVQRAEFDVVSE